MEEVMKPNILQDSGRMSRNPVVKTAYPPQQAAFSDAFVHVFSLSTLKLRNAWSVRIFFLAGNSFWSLTSQQTPMEANVTLSRDSETE